MKGAMSFMSKIIAVTSGKGGTGKSSISACLGYALAKQGNRTLIIELDFGLRCMDIMLGMQVILHTILVTFLRVLATYTRQQQLLSLLQT